MTDRLLQASVLFMTMFITAGLYFAPQNSLMSLASTDMSVYILRVLVACSAIAMLLTRPPRSSNMRLILGAIATLLFSWVTYVTLQQNFPILDGLLFSVASLTFGIAALEFNPSEKTVSA